MNRAFSGIAALFALGTLAVSPVVAQLTAVPNSLNFQGRLAKPDGTPVANGTYSVRFSLWNLASGGTAAANEKYSKTIANVAVRNGVFAVTLDAFPAGTFSGNLWLEVKIGADAALTPRTPLVTVPYAFKADSVKDGAITTNSLADGAVTAAKIAPDVFTGAGLWSLLGNGGTNPLTNFLGTTDAQSLVLRTANTERLRILPNGYTGIGTSAPNAQAHIAGGPTWTSNGWTKSLAINNAAAMELGYGTSNRFGLGASGGNLYLFSTPVEDTSVAANYRMVVNGSNGYTGFGIGTTAPFPVTVQTSSPNFGFMHTAGAVTVGTYVSASGGWFGTYSNHPLYFYTNNGGASMTISNTDITLSKNSEVQGRLYAHTGGDAVLGFSSSGYGVWGSSSTSDAIHGISDTGTGVFGYSRTGWAVFANGAAGGYSGWSNISDARYKQKVVTFDNALDAILNLRGVTFEWNREQWKEKGFAEGRQIGFIAQEVERVLPELVTTDRNGYKAVAYANVVPVLVEAFKAQNRKMEALSKANGALKSDNEAIRAKNTELEARLERIEAALKLQK